MTTVSTIKRQTAHDAMFARVTVSVRPREAGEAAVVVSDAAFDYKKKKDRREWVRARLERDGKGGWQAVKFPREGAGILSSLVESDGLVELPEGLTRLEAGTLVDFLPFSEVTT